MPKLNEITSLLNDKLKAGKLSGRVFQRGQFLGLVNTAIVDNEPFLFTIDGNEKDASIDDSFPFQIYHRNLSATYVNSENEQRDLVNRYSMVAVVFAKRKDLRLNESDLAFMIRSTIEGANYGVLSSSDLGTSGLNRVKIQFNSANFDSANVFGTEYRGFQYNPNPENLYFSINYTIEVKASNNCIECSEC